MNIRFLYKNYLIISLFLISIFSSFNGCSEDPVSTPQANHFQPNGMMILSESFADTLLYYFNGVYSPGKDTLHAPLNALGGHWVIKFLDANMKNIEPPSDPDHTLGWLISDPNKLEVYRHGSDIWEFHLRGKQLGETSMKFQVLHQGHADFTTIFLPVVIDTSEIGEVAGLKIYLEENDSLLIKDSAGFVSGTLNVKKNEFLGHLVVKFLDIIGNEFQFDPPSPSYSLGWILGNTSIAGIEAPSPAEPWAFRVSGIQAGATTLKLRFLLNGSPEFESREITINVTP